MKEFKPIPWSLSDIASALDLEQDSLYPAARAGKNLDLIFSGISTDSRSIKKDELFVALKGANFDGHGFIEKLVDKGIKGFVVEKKFACHLIRQDKKNFLSKKVTLFKVDDTLCALGMLAKFQRIRSGVKIVAITGSNGKTSTRKMVTEIFRTRFNTLGTKKNFNNEIGVPLTLLGLSYDHEWAVVEMGMNHPGELAGLAEMAAPDIAIITNTAKAHLEGLGTVLNVAEEKASILFSVKKGGTAVLNMDDPRWEIFAEKAEKIENIEQVIYIGTSKNADVRAESIRLSREKICFTLVSENRDIKLDICMNTPASFMVPNSLAAAAAAFQAGISPYEVKKGLESFVPVPGRMNIIKSSRGFHIIDDTYNANPASVKAALAALAALAAGKESLAVLGDMLELGDRSEQLHCEIGREAALSGVSRLYLYGNMADHVACGAVKAGFREDKIIRADKREIADNILDLSIAGAWILVKGSRGMKMEDVIAEII